MSIGWPYGWPASKPAATNADVRVRELEDKVAGLEIIVGYLTDFALHHLEDRHGTSRRFSEAADLKAAEQARTRFRKKILEKK
jgi:hypothetical protein